MNVNLLMQSNQFDFIFRNVASNGYHMDSSVSIWTQSQNEVTPEVNDCRACNYYSSSSREWRHYSSFLSWRPACYLQERKIRFCLKNQAPNLSLQLQQLCEKYIKFIEIYPHVGMVTQSSNEIPEADWPVITLLSSHISGQSDQGLHPPELFISQTFNSTL